MSSSPSLCQQFKECSKASLAQGCSAKILCFMYATQIEVGGDCSHRVALASHEIEAYEQVVKTKGEIASALRSIESEHKVRLKILTSPSLCAPR